MPYIDPKRRVKIRESIDVKTSGELNYIITQCLCLYRLKHQDSYQTFNDILGALEGAKSEFYRRVVVPYEEQKRFENGDVYT